MDIAVEKKVSVSSNRNAANNICDYIGIGFGPSHLSVAVALEEAASVNDAPLKGFFVEKGSRFVWQPGMLFEDTRLQVVFLKDLISMKNPRSRFTFINYLFEQERLHKFINLRTFYPTRIEFNDYFQWVAAHFVDKVRYGCEVIRVEPVVEGNGNVDHLEVVVRSISDGKIQSYMTKNLLIADGGERFIPPGIKTTSDGRVFHSHDFVPNLERHYPDRQAAYRFVIVGSGQTAADIFAFLIGKYPNADIKVAMRGFGFKPQDDTHFVNELFFPETTDLFFNLPPEKRLELLTRHADVTHSAVDLDLIPIIYDAMYNDQVTGRNRLEVCRFVELCEVRPQELDVAAVFRHVHNESVVEIACNAVILATGYSRRTPLPILKAVDPYLLCSPNGYCLDRCYSVVGRAGFQPKIFIEGYCEHTHGFSEVLLSLLPVRSTEIVEEMLRKQSEAGYDDLDEQRVQLVEGAIG